MKAYILYIYISDTVSPETAFLIVSTLFFKASWTESFKEGRSQEFTKTNGYKIKIAMMTRNSKKQVVAHFTTGLVQGRNDKCIALAIPYEVSMYITGLLFIYSAKYGG